MRESVHAFQLGGRGGVSKKGICASVHTFEPRGEVLLGQGL